MLRLAAVALTVLLTCGFYHSGGIGTGTSPLSTIIFSNAGTDGPSCGTLASPCATPAGAQTVARASIAASVCPTIEARGNGGPFFMAATLALTSADSGSGSCMVTWQTYPGDSPAEISGGRAIAGSSFSLCTTAGAPCQGGSAGIYQVSTPGLTPQQQIYVNGLRYDTANGPQLPGTWTLNSTTVTSPSSSGCSNTSIAGCSQPTQIRLKFYSTFTSAECLVASVSGATITPTSWCYGNVQVQQSVGFTNLFGQLINVFELLGTANCQAVGSTPTSTGGCFYWNPSGSGTLYVLPAAGVTMSAATVIVPQLTTLVTGTGAHNIAFAPDLHWEHQAVTMFDSDMGFVAGNVNNLICSTAGVCDTTDDPAIYIETPGALHFDGASHDISFSHQVFTHNAGKAVVADHGFQTLSIQDSIFIDNGAGCLTFGGLYDGLETNTAAQTAGLDFQNNQCGPSYQYPSMAEFNARFYRDSTVAHNDFLGLGPAGTGIGFWTIPAALGYWPWLTPSSTPYGGNNHFDSNRITYACQGSTFSAGVSTDCAPMHLYGQWQGSTFAHNDIEHMAGASGCMYVDQHTLNSTLNNNNCAYAASGAMIRANVPGTGNTANSNCAGMSGTTESGVTATGTVTYTAGSPPSSPPPNSPNLTCSAIIAAAGIQPGHTPGP
jgi:hypothetical protein